MKKCLFLLLSNMCILTAKVEENLFYDFYDAQMRHSKNILTLRKQIGNTTKEDSIRDALISKFEAAGGTKKFIEMYTHRCLRFAESYHTCNFLNQLKKYQTRLKSNTEMIKEIKSELKEAEQSIHEQQLKNERHPLISPYVQFHRTLKHLLNRAQESTQQSN